MRCTKAIINLKNLENNFKYIKFCVKNNVKICATVKADAYGHGAVQIAKKLESLNVDFMSIASVSEGLELRKAGIRTPILVLSLSIPEEISEIVKNNLTPLVFDEEYINLFEKTCKQLCINDFSVHLAVDTGMGRIGCEPNDCVKIAKYIASCKHLKLEGICTHFAASDNLTKKSIEYTQTQFNVFSECCKNLEKEGINPGIRHCSNSASVLHLPHMHLDMVRPGIILYGYYPDQITLEYLEKKSKPIYLKPVMTFETSIVAIRHIKKGQSVSYGYTWTAQKDTDIAVLPVGYADGLLRRFSPSLKVAINGKSYPVCGRICMDQCMIDIGENNNEVKRFDKVIIWGDRAEGSLQDATDLAEDIGTISYEVLTCISKRVPRVIIN